MCVTQETMQGKKKKKKVLNSFLSLHLNQIAWETGSVTYRWRFYLPCSNFPSGVAWDLLKGVELRDHFSPVLNDTCITSVQMFSKLHDLVFNPPLFLLSIGKHSYMLYLALKFIRI